MTSSPGAGRYWPRCATVAAVLLFCPILGAFGLGFSPANAAGETAYRLTSTASGPVVSASGTNSPLDASVYAAGPTTQSVVDSFGTSKGYAGSPHPGGFVMGLPGLLATLGAPTLPAYPLVVESDADTNDTPDPVDTPVLSLASQSEPQRSSAAARQGSSGVPTQAFTATADAVSRIAPDGSVQVDATSTVSGFSLPGVLDLGSVVTVARVRIDTSGTRTVESNLQVIGAKVQGLAVGFVDGRFVAPGTDEPIPGNPIEDVLEQEGVSIRLVKAQALPNGVASPALEISVVRSGVSGTPAAETYTTRTKLGTSLATIDTIGSTLDAGQREPTDVSPPMSPATSDNVGSADVSLPGPPTQFPGGGAGLPSAPGAVTGDAPAPLVAGGDGALTRTAAVQPAFDAANIYLAVVFAGVLLATATQLLRFLGVRPVWTS